MKPIATIPTKVCQGLTGILCDLDDTLTVDGQLLACSFDALWRARAAGLRVVLVTGRPAGWADHMARMWPIDAVVGENGAFYFFMNARAIERRWIDDDETRRANHGRLAELGQRITQAVRGSAIAADQFCRATDLAIDFCEDVPPLDDAAIDRIVEIFTEAGATAKVSSIHVNGWLGTYDKLSCCKKMAWELWQEDLEKTKDCYIFCGDSPNDEPMFEFFPNATAVANIVELQDRITRLPAYVTQGAGGKGFAELIDTILAARSR